MVPSMGLPPASSTTSSASSSVTTWSSRTVGIDRLQVAFSSSTASTIVVYRFALDAYTFGFEHATAAAAVSEWLARDSSAVFIANGLYFHEDYLPSGWFKTDGKIVGKRSFDRDKSALLELAPNVGIYLMPAEISKHMSSSREAAQSFPVLLSDGRAAVKEESGKVARRTFVGTDKHHKFLYVGVVPYAGISLFELSRALTKLPVQWDVVLNLDGGPSSGMAFRDVSQPELIDSYVTVPNVLVVRRK